MGTKSETRQKDNLSSLNILLGDTSKEHFYTNYFEKAPALFTAANANSPNPISIDDLDALITSAPARTGLRIVRCTAEGVTQSVTPVNRDGIPDLQYVHSKYSEGFTLILNGVHRRWPAIASFTAGLMQELVHQVGVNLYLTPARSQGFDAHYDGHDVFVWQLSGKKKWQVFSAAVTSPLENQKVEFDINDMGETLFQEELQPGSVLYIPRGFVHRAVTSEQNSMHLTIGIHSCRRVDLLGAAVSEAAKLIEEFRYSILPETPDEELAKILGQLGKQLLSEEVSSKAIASLRRQMAVKNDALEGNWFAAQEFLPCLDLSSKVKIRQGLILFASLENGEAIIVASDASLSGPSSIFSALQFIASHNQFVVGDLPDKLSNESKLVLIRRLIKEGLLVPYNYEESSDEKRKRKE